MPSKKSVKSKSTSVKPNTRSGGARGKLRRHFLSNLYRVMDSKELQVVSGNISEWARRVRELRDEEGFQILTHNDRSDLKPGQYLLEVAKPEPSFERAVSKETRALVLDRNGFTCQMCGAEAGQPHPYMPGKKTRLHIGHILDKSKGGGDELQNLRALCSVCNEGAQNITAIRPGLKELLILIRRSRAEDQVEALKWLGKKYPKVFAAIKD